MGKRLFLGLVVTGLGCLVWSGCKGDSSTSIVPPEDGGRTPTEGGLLTDGGASCPTDQPIDLVTLPTWKPAAAPQPGKCQEDDITAMRDYITQNPAATNEEFENFVKNRDTTCHDCVF